MPEGRAGRRAGRRGRHGGSRAVDHDGIDVEQRRCGRDDGGLCRRRTEGDRADGDLVAGLGGGECASLPRRLVPVTGARRIGRLMLGGLVRGDTRPRARETGQRRAHERDDDRQRQAADHCSISFHSSTRRSRSALAMTETELSVIAALAQMGLISTPRNGYSSPAATGTPSAL